MPQAVIAVGAKVLVAAGLKTTVALAVSSFVVTQTAISVASFAASKVLGRRSGGSATLQERQASVINIQLGEVPREAVFGTTTTGGSLVDAFSYGGQHDTDTFAQCIALADHEISRIVGYYVDDTYVPWSANGVQAGFNGKLSLLFQNATEAGHAPPAVALTHSSWSASDVGRGVARIWAFVTYDEQVWSQGFPRFRWVLEGAKVYDPRRDADLGYSGANPCDFDDPATWVVSQNPILLDYAYRRGIYVAGRHQQAGQLLVGRGLSALEAPPAAIIAAANVCDEVMGPGALRYRAAGVIRADQPFVEVAEMFAAACAGVIVQREGGVEIEPGQAKAAVVTITDNDLVVGEPVSFSSFLPDTEGGRVNTVVPRYVSPDQGWKDHAGPVRRSQDDITADGGPREATLALALVTDADQADRSAEIARRLYRLERRATIVLPPRFAYLEEGDWIAWTSARHGGATVRYRIESWSRGEDWRMRLTLREIAASVFGEADPIADQAIPAPAPVAVDALSLDGVTVEAITLAGETSTLPAVRFAWETPVDPAILAIRAEIRVTGETEISTARTEAVGEGVLVVTNGVAPGQSLQGRLVPIGHPSRPVVPSSWVTISTAEIGAAVDPGQLEALSEQGAITAAQLAKEALDRFNAVKAAKEDADSAVTAVTDLVEAVETDVAASIERLDLIEVELGEGEGSLGARVGTLEQVAVDLEAGKADASTVESLGARVNENEATINAVSSVAADAQGKVLAVVSVLLDANGRIAGYRIVNDGTTSTFDIAADAFRVFNGTSDEAVFQVTGGQVYVGNDRVATESMVANAVTLGGVAVTAGALTHNQSGWEQIQSLTLTTTGRKCQVSVTFFQEAAYVSDPTIQCRIVRGSTVIFEGIAGRTSLPQTVNVRIGGSLDANYEVDIPGQLAAMASFFVEDTPAAGSHTWSLQVFSPGSSLVVRQRGLSVVEFKR